jgi:hypothetical protein
MEGRWTIHGTGEWGPSWVEPSLPDGVKVPVVPCDDESIARAIRVLRTAPAANDRERVLAVVWALKGDIGA